MPLSKNSPGTRPSAAGAFVHQKRGLSMPTLWAPYQTHKRLDISQLFGKATRIFVEGIPNSKDRFPPRNPLPPLAVDSGEGCAPRAPPPRRVQPARVWTRPPPPSPPRALQAHPWYFLWGVGDIPSKMGRSRQRASMHNPHARTIYT